MSSLQAGHKQDTSYIWPLGYSLLPLAVMVSYKALVKEEKKNFFLLRRKNLDFCWLIRAQGLIIKLLYNLISHKPAVQLWINYSVSLGFLFWFICKMSRRFSREGEGDRESERSMGCGVMGERRAVVKSGMRVHVIRAWALWELESPKGVFRQLAFCHMQCLYPFT